jgi:hypothetical protein
LSVSRIWILSLAATLAAGASVACLGQAQPDAPKPAKTVKEKKPAAKPEGKMAGNYAVHQSLEMGGRLTNISGSDAMWATLVNMGTGARLIGQSLEMHSTDTSKTKFLDNLNSSSFGYGGDPYDVTRLKFNKGRIYDFNGSFRRDRNYFDYNLLDNSLLSTSTAATPALVQEPDSLHIFNTVRRNTDTMLTLFPLSIVSVRAGANFGVHEGPTYSTLHYAGDVQLLDMFKNSFTTYIAGADVKLAKRTRLSYDQYFVFFKGDTSFTLAGVGNAVPNGNGVYPVKGGNGELVSLGVDTLATTTCGTGANKSAEVVNGLANPFCSGTLSATSTSPIRTHFPTEQLRFSSRYWDKVSFNGRVLYSGGISRVNNFNQTFNGWNTRTAFRQEIQTGGMLFGQLAENKRDNTNADFGIVADLSKLISVSDVFDFWNMRTTGYSVLNTQTWYAPGSSLLTPISSITPCVPGVGACPASPATNTAFLNQKISSNTLMGTASITSKVKVSGGWRYKTREITDDGDDLTWHENWLLLGGVVQPSRMFRINANFDMMSSKSANSNTTPSNTYTREAPNALYHLRVRATAKPANWLSFSGTVNDYSAKNDDPLVNHTEHNRDYSFGAAINPTEQFSIDLNYAYDDVYSKTDLCYAFTPNPQAPLPAGAANAGTCTVANSPDNGDPSYYLGFGNYDAPVNFFSGAVSYSPGRLFHFSGGARLNYTNGSAEQLNPLMVPGALQSHYITPFGDVEYRIAPQWTWHGNFTRTQYSELGPAGTTASRNVSGNVTTLSVRYAF